MSSEALEKVATDTFAGRDVAVFIPCYNEAQTIGKDVADFRAAFSEAIIYVYDNNEGRALSRAEICFIRVFQAPARCAYHLLEHSKLSSGLKGMTSVQYRGHSIRMLGNFFNRLSFGV